MTNTFSNVKMTNYRWTICALLFFATTINYLDRQVLSLIQPLLINEFHWTDNDYGTITGTFSLVYAIAMLFAGKIVDKLGTRRGYAIAIVIWTIGAVLHAFNGILTEWIVNLPDAQALRLVAKGSDLAGQIAMISVVFFCITRSVLAIGEAGNFPAAIKATAEYFPKKDRAFATGIFNSGANVGAILAPLTVPVIAQIWGWEMAFVLIGVIAIPWMIWWLYAYKPISKNKKMNQTEIDYIQQDSLSEKIDNKTKDKPKKIGINRVLKYRQTWAFVLGKFLTDGVWWFFLFWMPAYLNAQYGMTGTQIAIPLAVLYTITVAGSVLGGKFPTYFINKGMNPYQGRMRAMLIIAFIPLLIILAQPLGIISYWLPVLIIAIGASAHQAWSANIFTCVSDMFPQKAVGTVVGIGGMAGGIGVFLINKGSGMLFTYADIHQTHFLGFQGKPAGYFIIFIICSFAYLSGWCIMKWLVPKYKLITDL